MSGRPAGNPPAWASNTNMSDPGKPWDGTPTKVMPALGIIQAGHLPNEQPPAERENWWKNDAYQRLDNLDMLEAQHWTEPTAGTVMQGGGGAGTVVGEITCATWHYGKRLMHVYNDTRVRSSVDGGYAWGTDDAITGASFGGIASTGTPTFGGTTIAAYQPAGAASLAYIGSTAGTWNTVALIAPGGAASAPSCVVADPYQANTFWVGGGSAVGVGPNLSTVWKVVSVGGALPTQTILQGGGGNSNFDLVAISPTVGIAATYDGATNRIATFDLAAGAFTVQASPTSKPITDILWLPTDGAFLMVASNGTGTETWISTTGATGTWTARSSLSFVATTIATYRRCAAVRGSLIVVPWNDGTNVFLALSGDLGGTWENIPDPMARHGSGNFAPSSPRRVRVVDNRFVTIAYGSAGAVYLSLGVRAGRPV